MEGQMNKSFPILALLTVALAPFAVLRGEEGELLWRYQTGNWVYSSPAVAEDGTIYVGSYDNHLHAVNPDGAMKWKFPVGAPIWSAPAIDEDGTIYFGSEDTYIYAVDSSGALKWNYKTWAAILSSATIGMDGTVYIGSGDNYLYALNPDGSLKWRFQTGNQVTSRPSIGADGTIYCGSYDSTFYAFWPDDQLRYSYEMAGRIGGSPAIGTDGTVYIGDFAGYLYAFSADGELDWSYKTGNSIWGSASIGEDGTIYFGSVDDYVYAVNPNGTLKWRYQTGGGIASCPAVGADGVIYIGSSDEYVYALNPDGSLRWRYKTDFRIGSSPAISEDGTLYIGSYDTRLYALECSSMGLASSPWPKYRHDNLNTSRYFPQLSMEPSLTEVDNEDGLLHPGQSADFLVTLENTGEGALGDLIGVLYTEDPMVQVTDSLGSWTGCEPDNETRNDEDPFTLRLRTNGEDGYRPELTLRVKDDLGHEFELDFQLFAPTALVEIPPTHDNSNFELLSTVGPEIVLRYTDRPDGFHASIFDATGRKVDELHATGASGMITWGKCYGSGVYFIRPVSDSLTATQKVILLQ